MMMASAMCGAITCHDSCLSRSCRRWALKKGCRAAGPQARGLCRRRRLQRQPAKLLPSALAGKISLLLWRTLQSQGHMLNHRHGIEFASTLWCFGILLTAAVLHEQEKAVARKA